MKLVHRNGRCFWIDTEVPSQSAGCANLREAIDLAMRGSDAGAPAPVPGCCAQERMCVESHITKQCLARGEKNAVGGRMMCTREAGHTGNHIACLEGSGNPIHHNLEVWPQEPAAAPAPATEPSAGDPATLAFIDAALQHHGSPAAGGAK